MRYLTDLWEDVPFKEQWHRIVKGLHAPKDSGEHRYAVHTLIHLIGPSSVSILGSAFIAMAVLFVTIEVKRKGIILSEIPPTVIDLTGNVLPDLPDPVIPEPEDLPLVQPVEPISDIPSVYDGANSSTIEPSDPLSNNTRMFGSESGVKDNELKATSESLAVFMGRSPIIIKNLRGRTGEDRQIALNRFGAPDGGGGGRKKGSITELAVRRALRWLKKEQLPDGSWKNTKPAMTGMALLAYLAHGDTPSVSKEFGTTVEKGIRWLLDNQESDGRFKDRDPHDYSHAIATYALCEAYGMTTLPVIKAAAERAVDVIIKGQHSSGGWDYNCQQSNRDDVSYMGWCIQALKAAYIARLENEGLKQALEKSVVCLKRSADSSGRFGYTNPHDGNGGLTGVGVLCLQMLGASREPECRNGVLWLEKSCTFDWEKPWLSSPIYYWYYITQAKFQTGGETWNSWNQKFAMQLIRNQKVEKNAIMDATGKMRDIGWWEPPAGAKGHSDGTVMDTALCTLQLEVYYRYLPTFDKFTQQHDGEPEANTEDLAVRVTSVPVSNR